MSHSRSLCGGTFRWVSSGASGRCALCPHPRRAGAARAHAEDRGGGESFALTLPSPAVLLNAMAERYTTTSRILLEFVDNCLDDAEALYEPADDDDQVNTEGKYQRPIEVVVRFDAKAIRISDNCRGMPRDDLTKVVLSVGRSAKKGAPSFLNGQFGFGMQAFRAACETLRVISKHDGDGAPTPFAIDVHRSRTDGFRVVPFDDASVRDLEGTGTTVELHDWDEQAMDTSPADMSREVELHFERILARQNLTIVVEDHTVDPPVVHTCAPTAPDDDDVLARVQLGFVWPPPEEESDDAKAKRQHIAADLFVLRRPREGHRPPRFFVQGRRISDVGATKSFTDLTRKRWSVWNHPCLGGYISVTGSREGALQPVITRDEFKRTRMRKACFTELLAVTESRLEEALEQINERNTDASMTKLEGVLSACLQGVTRSELRSAAARSDAASTAAVAAMTSMTDAGTRAVPMPEGDGGELDGEAAEAAGFVAMPGPADPVAAAAAAATAGLEDTVAADGAADMANGVAVSDGDANAPVPAPSSNPRRGSLSAPSFDVRLVRSIPGHGSGTEGPRCASNGATIFVSTSHPDFKERLKTSRGGREKFDERLIAYLAAVVSAGYRERLTDELVAQGADSREQFNHLLGTYCLLEERLRRALPTLLKELEAQQAAEAGDGSGGGSAAVEALRKRRYRDRL